MAYRAFCLLLSGFLWGSIWLSLPTADARAQAPAARPTSPEEATPLPPVTKRVPAPGPKGDPERMSALRERWRQLDPERRQHLQRLHQALSELPPERRRELLDQLRGLPAEEARARLQAWREMPMQERKEMRRRARLLHEDTRRLPMDHALRDSASRAEFHRLYRDRMLERARHRHLSQLGEDERAAFLALPPVEQHARLQDLLARHRERFRWQGVRRAFLESLPPGQREEFEQLPEEERRARFRAFLEERCRGASNHSDPERPPRGSRPGPNERRGPGAPRGSTERLGPGPRLGGERPAFERSAFERHAFERQAFEL